MSEDTHVSELIEMFKAAGGGGFVLEDPPDRAIPEQPSTPVAAMRMIDEELVLDGIPERNLATFVTTWMEPEAQRIISENLHRNFIDHAEYPRTAEIEQRCIRMLAELFNAPGETTGARTQGSSEAIMLGALSLKWKWRQRHAAEGKPTDKPNLVFGGDVHVVWEKFCRYFDVIPKYLPMEPGRYSITPDQVREAVDENTIGVVAILGTTYTGELEPVSEISAVLDEVAAFRFGVHQPFPRLGRVHTGDQENGPGQPEPFRHWMLLLVAIG